MVLPIVAYGHPVLRKLAQDIDANFPQLDKLIADMWETMYASNGVGLAAPQVNKDIRLLLWTASRSSITWNRMKKANSRTSQV
jgi:peptide deformylase